MKAVVVVALIAAVNLLSACRTNITEAALDVPTNGLLAAYTFCPPSECSSVSMGSSTRRLSYTEDSGIDDRWCIEVLFTRNGTEGRAAVEIKKTAQPNEILSWTVSTPVYNSDCSAFK